MLSKFECTNGIDLSEYEFPDEITLPENVRPITRVICGSTGLMNKFCGVVYHYRMGSNAHASVVFAPGVGPREGTRRGKKRKREREVDEDGFETVSHKKVRVEEEPPVTNGKTSNGM